MAQYFEVLSQSDGSVEQSGQFFNGNQENEPTQVRYILADDSRQFQAQQLILSADPVMVVDGSQQQIQGVVIDQSQINYQQANQPQQYSAVVQNANISNQHPQQIYYMETNNSGQSGENMTTVQTVIEQTVQHAVTQPPPIVLNHQIVTSTSNMGGRPVHQTPAQKPVLQIRAPRPGHIPVNPQNRSISTTMRPGLPQQVRPHQTTPLQMRPMAPQMRLRAPIQQIRQLGQQMQQRPVVTTQQRSQQMVSMINRQLNSLQQKQQQAPQAAQQPQQTQQVVQQQSQQVIQQPQVGGQMIPSQVPKGLNEFQRQQQQRLKNAEHQEMFELAEQTVSIGKQIKKPFSDFQALSDEDVDELDDHDPSMNSSPSMMANYKKFLEQRQQIGKNPILAKLSNNIKVTQTVPSQQHQVTQTAQNQQPQHQVTQAVPNQQPQHQVTQTAQNQQPQHQVTQAVPNQQQQHQVTQTVANQQQPHPCNVKQTIDEVASQVSKQQTQQQQAPQPQIQQQPQSQPQQLAQQQHPMTNVQQQPNIAHSTPQMPQKKQRAPARPKNPSARNTGAIRQRGVPRLPVGSQPFSPARLIGPQQPPPGPRFQGNQHQPRFTNQQQMMQQRMAQHQQVPQHPQPPPQQTQPLSQPTQPLPQQAQAQPVQLQHPSPPQAQPQPQQPVQQNGANQSQMNYLITPPTPNRPRQQRPLPAYIPSSQIQQIIESTPIAEEFSDSIRMLVLLENGEQRLITFTLPKEACTIQEILEQVNVPFTAETNIQVTEANTNGINYIVTVGNVSNIAYAANEEEIQDAASPESHPPQPVTQPANRQMQPQNIRPPFGPKPMQQEHVVPIGHSLPPPEPPKAPTPEPPKELPPKLIPGKLAVCLACGYTGEDFNKCTRCSRKLPDNVRSVDSPMKIDLYKPLPPEIAKHLPNHSAALVAPATPAKTNNSPKSEAASPQKQPSPKKKSSKSKHVETESVVISSDEEEDEKKPVKSVSEQLLKNLSASISISPITKEPSLTEIKKHARKLSSDSEEFIKITLMCRTVRIGSYRFVPACDVIIDTKCVIVKAPVIDSKTEIKTIRIDRGDIVKVLVCFSKSLPVIFYYLNVGAAPIIRDMLNMKKESGLYYDPIDEKEDSYRKITLLPEDFSEDYKQFFSQLYSVSPYNIMDELTAKEANDILIKTCPKDTSNHGAFSEIKQILLYPKEGQGRLSINTEDYVCLAVDQFLNDKIIDFYLKYLWENLPAEQQKKVHIFSTFFYKRLTTKAARKSHPFESDTTLTAAQKRHHRVKNWTKRINLFEKDFIVVPINENAHWFLAIICFPNMRGPQTFDGKPYKQEPKVTKRAKKKIDAKKEKPIPCDDPMLSDKDEAESADSDMESDDSEESTASAAAAAVVAPPVAVPTPVPHTKSRGGARVPIKQPCILIFDSLAGPSRCRVVATLRDYLTCEYKSKMDTERSYDRDTIKGASVKVPQQNNFTDCGLYLLQYVEQFFTTPIKDYHTPLKGINEWFEEIVVTRKREEICKLIKDLMEESGADTSLLPEIALPTLNGNIVERQESERDHETGEEEQEDMFTDIEDSEMTDARANNSSISKSSDENIDAKTEESHENSSESDNITPPGSLQSSPMKPSIEGVSEKTDIVATVTQPILKPSLSEFPIPRQTTNKDTLNYLKSKRIIRHKPPSDGPEYKKTKFDD